MMERKEKVKILVKLALNDVQARVDSFDVKLYGYTDLIELKKIHGELTEMLVSLDGGNKRGRSGMERAIADTWPNEDILLERILKASHEYQKLNF